MSIPTIDLRLGDCLDVMKEMEDNSVDSIVTDPPYGLSFMGKEWDYDVPSVEIWREALRVLKPGGHLLAFSGTRTYHRMVVNIEDAGFEIRDSIVCWLYFSGFPKSLSVSKAIDKQLGTFIEGEESPNSRFGREGDDKHFNHSKRITFSTPQSEEAIQWDGWGTALKPAHEPVCVARKPLIGTVVENVLEHGTGALNIDGCRIETNEKLVAGGSLRTNSGDERKGASLGMFQDGTQNTYKQNEKGRWPSNVIMDEVAGAILDEQAPMVNNPKNSSRNTDNQGGTGNAWTNPAKRGDSNGFSDGLGGGSRFFYCPKVSQSERNAGCDGLEEKVYAPSNQAKAELKRGNTDYNAWRDKDHTERNNHNHIGSNRNNHPTVKPISLMRYLAKLVTKEGGIVLDPFMGSGSTGIAACLEGFNFVGIEMNEEYLNIARHRIAHWGEYEIEEAEFIPKPRSTQMSISDWF